MKAPPQLFSQQVEFNYKGLDVHWSYYERKYPCSIKHLKILIKPSGCMNIGNTFIYSNSIFWLNFWCENSSLSVHSSYICEMKKTGTEAGAQTVSAQQLKHWVNVLIRNLNSGNYNFQSQHNEILKSKLSIFLWRNF